jgi:hypothetical protein
MEGSEIEVTLDAVIVSVTDDRPRIVTVGDDAGPPRIPSGPLDPDTDKTLERALRRWISEQAGIEVGYAEQLYTFGDRSRQRSAGTDVTRWLSVAYLALIQEGATAEGAAWVDVYELFPWEDHRDGVPGIIEDVLLPELELWAGSDRDELIRRRERIDVMFGRASGWDGIRVLERYELLYEAGLVAETHVDAGAHALAPDKLAGMAMAHDHRRIAAAALGRLRGKLTYRPVVFELLPDRFTLGMLQRTVEALAGVRLHTQNFRRLVERDRLVEGTGATTATGGRPAELFRFRPEVLRERPRPGVGVPYR